GSRTAWYPLTFSGDSVRCAFEASSGGMASWAARMQGAPRGPGPARVGATADADPHRSPTWTRRSAACPARPLEALATTSLGASREGTCPEHPTSFRGSSHEVRRTPSHEIESDGFTHPSCGFSPMVLWDRDIDVDRPRGFRPRRGSSEPY